jgi:hypothetical protein
MVTTGSYTPRFPGASGIALTVLAMVGGACQAAHHASEPATATNVIRVEVPESPARAFDLARDALGAVLEGTPENPRWLPSAAVLSTRYLRRRSGPVLTDILIIAAVGRQVADTLHPKVLVEVSAWTVDSPVPRTQFGASASSVGMVPRPRPLSRSETTDWATAERVVEYLVASGAKRIP